jgi:hypothetical protein
MSRDIRARIGRGLRATFVLACPPDRLRATFVLACPPDRLRANVPNVLGREGVAGALAAAGDSRKFDGSSSRFLAGK